jgi:uncharacterized protein YcfJ
MRNINLNPGGLIGAIVGGILGGVVGFTSQEGDGRIIRIAIAALFLGAYAGNFVWGRFISK